jgi:hypothetical protein
MRQQSAEDSVSNQRWIRSVGGAIAVGLFASTGSAILCLLFAGAGEGAASPSYVFFGPLLALLQLVPPDHVARARLLHWVCAILFVYYVPYTVALSLGRLRGWGIPTLAAVLLFHYWGVVFCVLSPNWDGVAQLGLISDAYGGWIIVLLVELFVVLHLLSFQYALSPFPYRPRLTRAGILILVTGLIAGVLLHLATRGPSPG